MEETTEGIGESIKLEKNSRGYNWSIRLEAIPCRDIGSDGRPTGKIIRQLGLTDIQRLVIFNDDMLKRFGEKEQ